MEDKKKVSLLKVIRAKCLDCCCGQAIEVRLCPCDNCPLHEFRMGKNPYNKRVLSEERKQQMREHMLKLNQEKKEGK